MNDKLIEIIGWGVYLAIAYFYWRLIYGRLLETSQGLLKKFEMNLRFCPICSLAFAIVGFVLGIYLPIQFMPDSNQGPLLFFITEPIGAVVGFLVGLILGKFIK